MDRGLLISVGVTILAVGLLFIYFRNKVSGIEKKVELMFNLIQNYEGSNNVVHQSTAPVMQNAVYDNMVEQNNIKSELIEVSDDDSEEVSDEESDDSDNEETLKFEQTNVELNDEDVKTIQLDNLEENLTENLNEKQDDDSLDDIDSDEDNSDEDNTEEEPQLEAVETIELTESDYKKKTVAELKQLAEERGLQNYKSLKKAPLIQLLMSQ